ncbi:MAG: response regulator [Alphaproteobacteria bacterium]
MPGNNAHILVVDDDTRLRELLRKYLSDNGFLVTTAGDAEEARRHLAAIEFDLLILDVMMPGENGFELTRSLREGGSIPILLLTAMSESDHRITGLESGADDYLSKPFEPRELVLRINNILRRVPSRPVHPRNELRFGECAYDGDHETLSRRGEPVHLTSAESALLKAFAVRPGKILSREDLCTLSGAAVNFRTVDVQITRLRKKIEEDPSLPRYLHTVRGQGYVLRTD